MRQVPHSTDLGQTVEQIQHRVDIMLSDNHNQLDEIRRKFRGEREKMRQSAVKFKEFEELYDQELQNHLPNSTALSKKMMSYFESSCKEWTLE